MFRELIINVAEHETRVALLEDGTIVELFINRGDETDITGNIYKGRVQRVLPGMQAAFVDIGLDQAAFLYVDDLIHDQFCDIARLFIDRSEDEGDHRAPEEGQSEGGPGPLRRQCHIEDIITEGQELLVHVAKSPIGTKGARVTSHVSLPGRFLVLMPSSSHIGPGHRPWISALSHRRPLCGRHRIRPAGQRPPFRRSKRLRQVFRFRPSSDCFPPSVRRPARLGSYFSPAVVRTGTGRGDWLSAAGLEGSPRHRFPDEPETILPRISGLPPPGRFPWWRPIYGRCRGRNAEPP